MDQEKLFISPYKKSFVITGNTKKYKDILKEKGARWNGKLENGLKGWIIRKSDIDNFLEDERLDIEMKDETLDLPMVKSSSLSSHQSDSLQISQDDYNELMKHIVAINKILIKIKK